MILILCKLPFQNMKHLLSDYFNVNETLLGSLQEKCTLQVTDIFSQNAFIIYAHLSNATVKYVIKTGVNICHLSVLKTFNTNIV